MEILHSYTPQVEQASIDEAYLDLTGTEEIYKSLETEAYAFPLSVAYAIKDQVKRELGFTVNVGISENKLLAKMASDFTKPDRVHTLYPSEVPSKMWPLPIGKLYGCGGKTAEKLRSIGIRTIGDAAKTDVRVLQSFLGEKSGAYIYASANGRNESPVSAERDAAKSYSNETTFSPDITKDNFEAKAPKIVEALAESVGRRLRRDQVYISTVEVSVKTNEFKRRSKQKKLSDPTDSTQIIQREAEHLLRQLCFGEERDHSGGIFQEGLGIRLIGVGGSGIDDGSYRQMNLFDLLGEKPSHQMEENPLDQMMDQLEQKFGRGVVHKGNQVDLKRPEK